MQAGDWPRLPELFSAAFQRVQPFASLADRDRLAAAEDCLAYTRGSNEGPLVGEACFVAACGTEDTLVGANLVTLPPSDAIGDAPGLAASDLDLRQSIELAAPWRWVGHC